MRANDYRRVGHGHAHRDQQQRYALELAFPHGPYTTRADTSDEILRSKELELSLERLLSSVRDAETGQRGYIVTGSESYLFPYDKALQEIDGRLQTVEVRMQARGGSNEQVQALRDLVTFKLDELARTIELTRAGEHTTSVDEYRQFKGFGIFTSQDFRREFGAAVERERGCYGKIFRDAFAAEAGNLRPGCARHKALALRFDGNSCQLTN